MKFALVIGGAECVNDDIAQALELFSPDAYYAVNDIGAHLERLDVWCTLHPEHMDKWEEKRRLRGLGNGYEIVAPPANEVGMHGQKGRVARRVSYRWKDMRSSASSGIFATKVAIEDGFSIVLAGIPMRIEDGHFERHKPWSECTQFLSGFDWVKGKLKGQVKSMSGMTREVLGAPTPEWFNKRRNQDGT